MSDEVVRVLEEALKKAEHNIKVIADHMRCVRSDLQEEDNKLGRYIVQRDELQAYLDGLRLQQRAVGHVDNGLSSPHPVPANSSPLSHEHDAGNVRRAMPSTSS